MSAELCDLPDLDLALAAAEERVDMPCGFYAEAIIELVDRDRLPLETCAESLQRHRDAMPPHFGTLYRAYMKQWERRLH